MAKTRAYRTQDGVGLPEMVTAKEVERRRLLEFNGQPTGERFYSTHKPGRRFPVKHVIKDGNSFFSYIEGVGGSGSGGESLNHLLFKEALLSVERMRLSLSSCNGQKVDVPIRVRHVEVEKKLEVAGGGLRYVDVYIEFLADHWLASKWDGKVYIEVHHSNAVDAKKQEDLRAVGVPVIEVDIPDIFSYKISEEETTDDLEQQHKARIKRILEGQSGFLRGVVLSDPCSKEFLEGVVSSQREMLTNLLRECSGLKQKLELSVDKLSNSSGENSRLVGQVGELEELLAGKRSELAVAVERVRRVENENAVISNRLKSLAKINIWLICGLVFVFLCFICLGYLLI